MEFFAKGPAPSPAAPAAKPWCVLLVDDDAEVHDVTRLALRKFEFQQRGLELLSAYSAREAQQVFRERPDIALAVVDVVMETEHAGLELVRWLREEGVCPLTRLVLRTGQAGLAPEEQVIRQFDIDAYKEKTELTTLKLRSVLYTALRNFRTLADKEAEIDHLLWLTRQLGQWHQTAPSVVLHDVRARLQNWFSLREDELDISPGTTSPAALRVRPEAMQRLTVRQRAHLQHILDTIALAGSGNTLVTA